MLTISSFFLRMEVYHHLALKDNALPLKLLVRNIYTHPLLQHHIYISSFPNGKMENFMQGVIIELFKLMSKYQLNVSFNRKCEKINCWKHQFELPCWKSRKLGVAYRALSYTFHNYEPETHVMHVLLNLLFGSRR